MEQKLTNAEIAKVFAMYWGCDFQITNNDKELKIHKVTGATHNFDKCSVWTNHWGGSGFEPKLILTPLSRITNEDAIEVNKLQDWHDFELPLNSEDRRGLRDQIIVSFKNEWVNYTTYQYLISNGYAVPLFFSPGHWANGQNAIQLGIAIDGEAGK